MQQSETRSFVQQIKQKQEDFKKTVNQTHRGAQSLPFNSLTSPNQRREQTPNQRRQKIESDNSCSPTLFRTPQISLHYDNTRRPLHSNNRSRNENVSTYKERREAVNSDSATRDYQKVLDEVMKKYRQLQQELLTKDKEVQKTKFYKDEYLKEKKRNEVLIDRNKHLKNKILKIVELVQKDQLQQNDDQEIIISSLKQENMYLRQMLHLYDTEDAEKQLDQYEHEQEKDVDYVDSILNVFLGDLKTLQNKRKEKRDNQQMGQFNLATLSLTVLNKESSFVDLSEDSLLMEQ